jgi:glycosyltransferase involved in cell wall biosynthesis
MSAPSVSVVIPAYNAVGYLKGAVDSVLAQTYPVHEIIVVDDGSADSTFEIASRLPSPVRAIRKANGGPASARNTGVREATGDWIAFLDADDAWIPGKLERQLALVEPDTGVVHCLYKPSLRPPDKVTFGDLWERNCIATSTVIIRRKVFQDLGGFDEDREIVGVEDYNLWLKLAAGKWQIRTLQENLISYTPATGSLTRQVERFARAELASLQKIGADLGLDAAMVEARRVRILDQYGRELLYHRHMERAREYLRLALQGQFSLSRLAWWTASLAPEAAWETWGRVRGR